jgi:hypothetical protein
LGQLGRRQRVSDRAQIVQLVLGDLEALMQRGEISVAYRDFLAKASDQRLLDMLSFVQIVHVPLLGGDRRSQPLKLPFVVLGVFAHASPLRAVGRVSHAPSIVSHGAAAVHALASQVGLGGDAELAQTAACRMRRRGPTRDSAVGSGRARD